MVVYNVVDMKRRGSPAIKYGSSGSVTETGAQQGKSSSTVTIRQTEGNGQEKSSGRASVENVGKIERRSPPSFNGSSNSVDETGARRGKSSSTVTIRQTEGNSQEKSSGRARDTAARRRMSAEERKNTPPELGDADTVFADGNTMAAYAEANGNIRRNNIEYADNAARNAAQKALHDHMVNEGKILDLTENRENVSQYFPDLRSMPKAERTGLLREKIQTLKNDLRTYLNQLKGVNFEFEINGNTIEATVYNAGIKEVLQNLTQDKAGMLSASEEIFRNAEYLYSTQDKTGSPNVTGWDYFYVPVKIGGDTVGVRIAIRNMAFPTESQIYNWGIKREDTSLDGVGLMPGGRTSADVSSDVSSTATIRQTEGNSQEKSSGKASVVDQDGNYINIKNEAPGNTKTGVTVQDGVTRGPKASSDAIVHSDTGDSQEKSSGRAGVEVSGINNRTAAELGDADTVFADGSGASMAYVSNDAARFNPEGKTQDELLHDIMDSAEPFDQRYLYFGRFTDSFRTAMEKAGVEVKNLPVIMSYRDAYLAMESRENGRYQGQDINYHNLGIEGMKSAMENIGKPDAVMKSKRDGKIELFLDFVDYKGNRGLAIVQLDSNAQHAQEFIRANIVTSIYGKRRGDAYLEKAKSEGRLVYSKEEGPAQGITQVQYESNINAKPSSTDTIRQTEGNSQEKSSGKASVEVENRNTETSEEDARRDFSPAGEPPRVHLAADSFCSITHALMPQKLRLRRNRSAFFCPRQRQTAFPSVQILSRKAYTKKDSLPHRAGNPFWYARRDLNPRPLAPEANTLSS